MKIRSFKRGNGAGGGGSKLASPSAPPVVNRVRLRKRASPPVGLVPKKRIEYVWPE